MLLPGQSLYFSRGDQEAEVLADGHIRCGELTGSIHAVAKSLMNGVPANGWELWIYIHEGGERRKIDDLRAELE